MRGYTMKNRVLSLLIVATAAAGALQANTSNFWNNCKAKFNEFSAQAQTFGKTQYEQRSKQANEYWKSGKLQDKVNTTASNWNNPAGYVGGFSGLFGFLATNRFFKTGMFRRFAPVTIAATVGMWAGQRGKGCVEHHFPKQDFQKNDTMEKEA